MIVLAFLTSSAFADEVSANFPGVKIEIEGDAPPKWGTKKTFPPAGHTAYFLYGGDLYDDKDVPLPSTLKLKFTITKVNAVSKVTIDRLAATPPAAESLVLNAANPSGSLENVVVNPTTTKEISFIIEGVDEGPITCRLVLVPLEITAAFGEGPNQVPAGASGSKDTLEAYLTTVKLAQSGKFWILNGKSEAQDNKIWGLETTDEEKPFLAALAAGKRNVVFDGHSNFGIGPHFDVNAQVTSISDLTNLGVGFTDVPLKFRLRGVATNPDNWGDPYIKMIITDDLLPKSPKNKLIPAPINRLRYPNDEGVGDGQKFKLNGLGYSQWHFTLKDKDGNNIEKVMIVLAPDTDLPSSLKYKSFFYNACDSGVDYIGNFAHGDFIFTNILVFISEATYIYTKGVTEGKKPVDIVPLLNKDFVGGLNLTFTYYGIKEFKKIFDLLLISFFSSSALCDEVSDDHLLEKVTIAVNLRSSKPFGRKDKAFKAKLVGLTDKELIRGFALYLFTIDQDPQSGMRTTTPLHILQALRDNPNLITDETELRKMLIAEQDPRKFWLLSTLIPCVSKDKNPDFVPELTHMLFRDGRVTVDQREYTPGYSKDVSIYAYVTIFRFLKSIEADFELPDGRFSNAEKELILAKWLKKNWNGCEDLKIPKTRVKIEKK